MKRKHKELQKYKIDQVIARNNRALGDKGDIFSK